MKSKGKYENPESSSSESLSEDDEDGQLITQEVEKEFYKTLSRIKNKDPTIYDKDTQFFECEPSLENNKGGKKKATPLTLRDYERKLILEKGGELSDDEQSYFQTKDSQPTYIEEQDSLKKSFKNILNDDSEDADDEPLGGLFKKRDTTNKDKEEEERNYKEWLKGQQECASDEEVQKNLKPLRDFWTDRNLNEEDKFLRDYVLNKKFLENDNTNEDGVDDKLLVEEDNEVEARDTLYSHRFEELDHEFIKRYPRVMENSLRRKNDHRKKNREEVKERKLKEKEKKQAEVKQKKKLKKMEIEAKIEELKKLTGNDKLAFEDVLNQDFDLDEHDKAMQKLFNEEFYSQDDPNFLPTEPGINEAEAWNEEDYADTEGVTEIAEHLSCEDPNFNMDCEYEPALDKTKPKASRSRRRKDKHRRTTVSEAVSREKPKFDPEVHHSFKEYLDEYYAIDCEDFIGDMPCRFKYRRTVPNSYGLTIEEILKADVKELDRWCSIKRIHQLRPDYKEKCDVKVFQKKAADERLKRKILPCLFEDAKVEEEPIKKEKKSKRISNETTNNSNKIDDSIKSQNEIYKLNQVDNKVKRESKPNKNKTDNEKMLQCSNKKGLVKKNTKRKFDDFTANNESKTKHWSINKMSFKPKEKCFKKSTPEDYLAGMSDARLLAYGIKPKRFRNKLKYKNNM